MSEQRHHYRKQLFLLSYLIREGQEEIFYALDLSLSGIRARFEDDPHLIVGSEVYIRMPGLKLQGEVRVMRCRPAEQGNGYDIGFDFLAMDGVGDNSYRFRKEEEEWTTRPSDLPGSLIRDGAKPATRHLPGSIPAWKRQDRAMTARLVGFPPAANTPDGDPGLR